MSWEQGVKATVDSINNGNYPEVVRHLKAHDAAYFTLSAVRDSKWGTFHVKDGDPPVDIAAFVDGVRARWSLYAGRAVPS